MVHPDKTAVKSMQVDELLKNSTAPATMTLKHIDFIKTPLAREYGTPARYAVVIDDAFSAAECAALVEWAQSNGSWERAMINIGGGRQRLAEDARKCGRILVDDARVADWLLRRVRPLMEEDVGEVFGGRTNKDHNRWPRVAGMSTYQQGCWRMTRLNERLRFLKYGPGEYFRPHADGQYRTPDGKERSFITFHLYLSPDDPDLIGGSTTFWSLNMRDHVEVEPKQGRVLVFQHADLQHSGDELESGEKITIRSDFMYERVPDEEKDT